MPNGLLDNWEIAKNLWKGFGNNPRNQETVDAAKGLLGILPLGAGDVASGLLAADDVRRGDYTSAGLNGLGVLPYVPSLAGMFIGKGAKVWDALKAEEAMNLAKQGVDPREIWKKTGTFQGVDGAWRQEIPDNASSLNLPKKISGDYKGWIDQRLNHEKAFSSYPDLKDITVNYKSGIGESGNFIPSAGMVGNREWKGNILAGVGAGKMDDAQLSRTKSTTLHELQHAIQEREGWARGGSPEMFKSSPVDGIHSYEDMLRAEKILNMAKDRGLSVSEFAKNPSRWMDDKSLSIAKLFENKSPQDFKYAKDYVLGVQNPNEAYMNLAGEAEARATQARMNLTMPERLNKFPFDSYDVPKEQLIVRGLLGQ